MVREMVAYTIKGLGSALLNLSETLSEKLPTLQVFFNYIYIFYLFFISLFFYAIIIRDKQNNKG